MDDYVYTPVYSYDPLLVYSDFRLATAFNPINQVLTELTDLLFMIKFEMEVDHPFISERLEWNRMRFVCYFEYIVGLRIQQQLKSNPYYKEHGTLPEDKWKLISSVYLSFQFNLVDLLLARKPNEKHPIHEFLELFEKNGIPLSQKCHTLLDEIVVDLLKISKFDSYISYDNLPPYNGKELRRENLYMPFQGRMCQFAVSITKSIESYFEELGTVYVSEQTLNIHPQFPAAVGNLLKLPRGLMYLPPKEVINIGPGMYRVTFVNNTQQDMTTQEYKAYKTSLERENADSQPIQDTTNENNAMETSYSSINSPSNENTQSLHSIKNEFWDNIKKDK
jgi:hypothetical protein